MQPTLWQQFKKFVDGYKRNIGLTLNLTAGFALARGWIDEQAFYYIGGVLAAWGLWAISDGVKKAIEAKKT